MSDDPGIRISEVMTAITAEIPKRLNIIGILKDAHERISRAATPDVLPANVIIDKVTEVLREIATHAVEEFTRRTGQAFLWVDEPDEEPEILPGGEPTFGVNVKDGKGYLSF